MQTIRSSSSLRRKLLHWREQGDRIALVPTMGNLHRGHLSLVSLARKHAERVVVSIFVNPTQFGPREDYSAYPRTLAGDRRSLRPLGTDLVYTPDAADLYPFGLEDLTQVTVPKLTEILCGESRPGHFDGVTGVVCRLLNQVQPDVAVFGRKDYQQLLVIKRMVADLHMPVRIVAGATQRESDGLALSSRNQYLSAAQRSAASEIYRSLRHCAAQLRAGDRVFAGLEKAGRAQMKLAGLRPDYFAVRANDLGPPDPAASRFCVLAAAFAGKARLIDNISLRA